MKFSDFDDEHMESAVTINTNVSAVRQNKDKTGRGPCKVGRSIGQSQGGL